jgi:glucokinase
MSSHGELVSPLHIPAWRDFPLRGSLAELTGLPTYVDNDAKALALAEGWLGAASDVKDFIAVVIGTGVGGGLVSGGRLVDGRSGNAGHIGHVIVEEGGRECRCGARGCLEAYLAGHSIETETGRGAAYANPALVERNGRYLGRALAGVAAVCDIRRAVLSGGVAQGWGEPFIEAATQEFAQRSRLAYTKGFSIVPAGLGANAALVGAAAVAFVRHERPVTQ